MVVAALGCAALIDETATSLFLLHFWGCGAASAAFLETYATRRILRLGIGVHRIPVPGIPALRRDRDALQSRCD